MEWPIRRYCLGRTQGSFKKQLDATLKKWNTSHGLDFMGQ